MKKTYILFLLFIIPFFALKAQDRHFSQFYANPLNLNPALSGVMAGKYRLMANYRNQWSSVSDFPFVNIAVGFDFHVNIGNNRGGDKLGFGMIFNSEKAGITQFSTNQVDLSVAFHKSLNFRKTQYLSGGIQMGIAQKNVNFERVNFNDQFDGVTGYSIPSSEALLTNNIAYSDLSAGIFWTYNPKEMKSFHFGLSGKHVNLPNISFEDETKIALDPLLTAHFGAEFPIARKASLLPRVLAYYQGAQFQANAGANLKFLLSDFNGASLYIGTWARPVFDVKNSISVDAVVLLVAFEIDRIRFGFSFDGNISSLTPASSGVGAFEISVGYTGKDLSKTIYCPTF